MDNRKGGQKKMATTNRAIKENQNLNSSLVFLNVILSIKFCQLRKATGTSEGQ